MDFWPFFGNASHELWVEQNKPLRNKYFISPTQDVISAVSSKQTNSVEVGR